MTDRAWNEQISLKMRFPGVKFIQARPRCLMGIQVGEVVSTKPQPPGTPVRIPGRVGWVSVPTRAQLHKAVKQIMFGKSYFAK